ncbi:MAG: alpha/beta fold hydrolase [Pseudomonadota bacterium]
MAVIDVDAVPIGHRHEPADGRLTFVFVNALTGSGAMWEAAIAPALRARGYGTLTFDLPGQTESPVAAAHTITAASLTAATAGIVRALGPNRPAYVGLSIGGLFALQAHLAGANAEGFVLVNTLRKADARLAWINDAVVRLATVGGGRLLRDVYGPLLFDLDWLSANRAGALETAPYVGLTPDDADLKLLEAGCSADWDVPYEQITAPTVVLTGLRDRVFYDEANVASLAARLPDAVRHDVVDAAHLLPAERPNAVINACLSLAGRIGDS